MAAEVGAWAVRKHEYLRRYLDISRGARGKFLGPRAAGATFIDLFCGAGCARIRKTHEWIDGSAVAAWKISVEGRTPFSSVFVSDIDDELRAACVERLRRLGAPVVELRGAAVDAARAVTRSVHGEGLHFAFIDPFGLGALDFSIIRTLSELKRIDMLVHVSAMDLRRNLEAYVSTSASPLDSFAPGWRGRVDLAQSQMEVRRQVVEYWRRLVLNLGVDPSTKVELIRATSNAPLYWLLLVARHKLAHEFWNIAANVNKQSDLFR